MFYWHSIADARLHLYLEFTESGGAIQKYHVKSGGRTAYESMMGHRVRHVAAGRGEPVLLNVATYKNAHNHLDGEWADGYSEGVRSRLSE